MEPFTLALIAASLLIPADTNELGFSIGGCGIDAANWHDHLCTNGLIYKPYYKRNYIDKQKGINVFFLLDHSSHLEKGDLTFNVENQTPAMNSVSYGMSYKW